MKTHARVVVIGGGVVGAGTLYPTTSRGRGGPTWCWWSAGS